MTRLFLSLSHGEELEPVPPIPHPLCQFGQVPSRIRTGTQDKHNGREGGGLVVDALKADHRWCDVLLSHSTQDVVGDGTIDTVNPEAPQEKELL